MLMNLLKFGFELDITPTWLVSVASAPCAGYEVEGYAERPSF